MVSTEDIFLNPLFPYIVNGVLMIVSFIAGLVSQRYFQKVNDTTGKAGRTNENEIKPLKSRIAPILEIIKIGNAVKISSEFSYQAKVMLNENYFIEHLKNSDIFQIKNGEIYLAYNKDRILNEHGPSILNSMNNYSLGVKTLKGQLEGITEKDIPAGFEQRMLHLLARDFGRDGVGGRKNLDPKDLLPLFLAPLSGSTKSCTAGHSFVVQTLKERYGEIREILKDYPATKERMDKIDDSMTLIEESLSNLETEICALQSDWQNKWLV